MIYRIMDFDLYWVKSGSVPLRCAEHLENLFQLEKPNNAKTSTHMVIRPLTLASFALFFKQKMRHLVPIKNGLELLNNISVTSLSS